MSISTIPPYYTWVIDKLLAISATPYHHTHLNYLISQNIHTVVSFLDNVQPPFHTNPLLKVIAFPAKGFLSVSECQDFVQLMENAKRRGEAVLVHASRGVDIAGVLVACYLVKKWECPADFAIYYLRGIMPSCIENKEQESLVYKYYNQVFGPLQKTYVSKVDFLGKEIETVGDDPYQNRVLE